MTQLPHVRIHDPDVVITDLGLAVLGLWLAWRIRQAPRGSLTVPAILILGGQAAAALAGAIFHGHFTQGTRTPGGYAAWLPIPLSIAIVSATLLHRSIEDLVPKLPAAARHAVVAVYAVTFVGFVLLVDESFGTVVRFYAPVLGLFLLTAMLNAWRWRSRAWTLMAVSFAISVLAAAVQRARLGFDPVYFDHNAVYHVVQAIALVVLYRGVRLTTA